MPEITIAPDPASTVTAAPAASVPHGTPSRQAQSPMQRPRPKMEAMNREIERTAKPADGVPPAETTTSKTETKAASPETKQPETETKTSKSETESPKTETKTEPATDDAAPDPKLDQSKMPPDMDKAVRGENGKVQPWKLANWYKDRFGDAQAEIAKLRTEGLAPAEKQEYLTRIEKAEAKLKEYDDEIRHVRYEKSTEFKEKYQAPYEAAWKRAMDEIGELTLPNPDGSQRAVTPQDLLELVNLPLGKARAVADELYGPFADDVMTHRKEIKRLADDQSAALKDAKENGAKREKERVEMQTKSQLEVSETIQKTFKAALASASENKEISEFFQPKEGDEAWNKSLEEGKQMFKAMYQEPDDPKLSAKERAELVEAHAAIFNRSAAFGPMRRLIKSLRKELADVKKENEGFKGSRPDASGGTQSAATPATNGMSRMEQMKAALAQPDAPWARK